MFWWGRRRYSLDKRKDKRLFEEGGKEVFVREEREVWLV